MSKEASKKKEKKSEENQVIFHSIRFTNRFFARIRRLELICISSSGRLFFQKEHKKKSKKGRKEGNLHRSSVEIKSKSNRAHKSSYLKMNNLHRERLK